MCLGWAIFCDDRDRQSDQILVAGMFISRVSVYFSKLLIGENLESSLVRKLSYLYQKKQFQCLPHHSWSWARFMEIFSLYYLSSISEVLTWSFKDQVLLLMLTLGRPNITGLGKNPVLKGLGFNTLGLLTIFGYHNDNKTFTLFN